MPAFHDVQFPLPLAFGASGGPQRQTDIVTLANGHEQRNTARAHSRRRYDAGIGIKSLDDVRVLIAFFEARRGQLYGFRFRDPVDNNSAPTGNIPNGTDQILGIGDGTQTQWQLVKTYGDTQGNWQRQITKPVQNSVVIALGGTETSGFVVDDDNGIVTFNSPPTNGVSITAGFKFDVPVRFDIDHLNVSLESFGAGGAVHVPLLELVTAVGS